MIAVAPTDINWFEFLRSNEEVGTINFWAPTPWNVKQLKAGDRLYFLLKSPIRKIAGYGNFVEYKNLPLSEAWNYFNTANGSNSLSELKEKVISFRRKNSTKEIVSDDPTIGCIILNQPIFLDDDEFFDPAAKGAKFDRNIVKFKYFEADPFLIEGKSEIRSERGFEPIQANIAQYSQSKLKLRKGQAAFKTHLTRVYGGKCCISGESCSLVLDACHIQPYLAEDSNHIQNGLLLRKDLHKLFDSGRIQISDRYEISVTADVLSADYRKFHEKKISVPDAEGDRPSIKALYIHRSLFSTNK